MELGGGRPAAPRPYALTAKIAPRGRVWARAWRVIPYRASTSRSTPQVAGSSLEPRVGTPPILLSRRPLLNLGQDPVELGEQSSGNRTPGGPVLGAVDIPLQQVLDLLLPAPPLGRVGRPFGVEAEQDGVAVGEERSGSARRSRA